MIQKENKKIRKMYIVTEYAALRSEVAQLQGCHATVREKILEK